MSTSRLHHTAGAFVRASFKTSWVIFLSLVRSHDSYLICWRVSTAETKQASLLLDTICDDSLKRCLKMEGENIDSAAVW